MNRPHAILGIALGLALSACTLAPHYERPAAPVAARYPTDGEAAAAVAAADIGWRDFFADAQLQELIQTALANNRDLRVATLNVAAARAQYRIQRADLLPTLSADGALSRQRTAEDLRSSASAPAVTQAYSASLGVSAYELDLFGRVQSLSRARLQQYLGTVEAQRSAQISLVAEVASAYLAQIADRELLQMTTDTLQAQQASYDLTHLKYEQGTASALDLRNAETALAAAQANLALYRRQLQQDGNALSLLLGAPLPQGDAQQSLAQEGLLTELPAGLPSELLLQRPDVLAAEHELIAANANIGAARAAFLPSISLTASYGTASSELSGLFDAGSRAWTFAPSIRLPIFAFGALKSSLDLAQVQKNIQVAQYEKTIQTAFREVADALVARATLDDQLNAQDRLLAASEDSYRLAQLRFAQGVDSYLVVLDAQRTLYAARQADISVRLQRLQNLIALYKALGGGWQERMAVSAR